MDTYEMSNLWQGVALQDKGQNARLLDSSRSSFDQDYFRQHACTISIRDAVGCEDATSSVPQEDLQQGTTYHQLPQISGFCSLLPNLEAGLDDRNTSRTRWINIIGWNETMMDKLAKLYLDDHGCLNLDFSKQMLGGPIRCGNGREFIWIQTSVWFLGDRSPNWSSVQQCGFRMVICMPKDSEAGTLITNFAGKSSLAQELSSLCTDFVLQNHSMGSQALGNVWILAFAILREIAAQVDFAFQAFDPTSSADTTIPRMDDLPFMLERASNLARIDRYISGLEEFSSFLAAVRSFQLRYEKRMSQREDDDEREALELALAQLKITRAQQLCTTFLRQYESLVQMTISYSTTELTERLEHGSKIAEKFGTIGLILASLSGSTSPLGLLVGYFGMNVQEMVNGGLPTLFDFWQVALPVILMCIVGLVSLMLRLMSTSSMSKRR